MMIIVSHLTVDEMRREGGCLLEEQCLEMGQDQRVMNLAPDWDRYETLEARRCLVALGAREHNERLVGYAAFLLSHPLHYKRQLVGMCDVIFLTKAFRKGGNGLYLIRECEKALEERGVIRIGWTIRSGSDTLGRILLRRGYRFEEYTMARTLGD